MDKIVKATPVFWKNKECYEARNEDGSRRYRVIANEGSSGSSKTHSLCQLMPVIALSEKKSISIVSPSLPHLKRGAMRNFLEIINDWGIYSDNDYNMTNNVYNFPKTKSYIEFFGADDAGKVRGPRRDILYFNELNLSNFETYTQLSIRTNDVIFFDLNPADEHSFCYSIADAPGNKKIHSTYKNNLGNLTKENIKAIEDLQYADENLWRVYGLGLRGTSSETIYTHWKECDALPNRGEQWYGVDFGFNVPSALTKIEFYEGALYWDQEIYETKLTTSDLIERFKSLGVDKRTEMFCDNAEPKTIEEIHRAGYNAKPADKDVTEGIRFVKGLPLFVTRRSVEGIKELKSYKWKKDKDGKVLDEPVKFMDHFCFVSETLITTDKGLRLIKDIEINDMVLTSQGYKKVVNKFDNGLKEVWEYQVEFRNLKVTIKCTPDHLIKTISGWKQIHTLTKEDVLFIHKPSIIGCTKNILKSTILKSIFLICILMFGSRKTAKYQKAFMYTIRKVYLQMILMIWNCYLDTITFLHTLKKELENNLNGIRTFSKKELRPHPNGIKATLAGNGTSNMQLTIPLTYMTKQSMLSVTHVAKYLKHQNFVNSKVDFAPTIAKANGAEMQDWIISKENVHVVEAVLLQTNTTRRNTVQQAALLKIVGESVGKRQVYDLEVEDMHEYFANGILASNCDSGRYGSFTKLSKPKRIVLI